MLCVFRCQLWQMCFESASKGFASDDWSACSEFGWSSSPMCKIYWPRLLRGIIRSVGFLHACHVIGTYWYKIGIYDCTQVSTPWSVQVHRYAHVHVHIVNRGSRSQLNSIVFGCEWAKVVCRCLLYFPHIFSSVSPRRRWPLTMDRFSLKQRNIHLVNKHLRPGCCIYMDFCHSSSPQTSWKAWKHTEKSWNVVEFLGRAPPFWMTEKVALYQIS